MTIYLITCIAVICAAFGLLDYFSEALQVRIIALSTLDSRRKILMGAAVKVVVFVLPFSVYLYILDSPAGYLIIVLISSAIVSGVTIKMSIAESFSFVHATLASAVFAGFFLLPIAAKLFASVHGSGPLPGFNSLYHIPSKDG